MTTNRERAAFAVELSYDSSTGDASFQPFNDVLAQNPAIIIFDNTSNVTVEISDNGTTVGKTFRAGSALALDLSANAGKPADCLTWPLGTQFYARSAAGTGSFFISVVYAR